MAIAYINLRVRGIARGPRSNRAEYRGWKAGKQKQWDSTKMPNSAIPVLRSICVPIARPTKGAKKTGERDLFTTVSRETYLRSVFNYFVANHRKFIRTEISRREALVFAGALSRSIDYPGEIVRRAYRLNLPGKNNPMAKRDASSLHFPRFV